MRNWVNIGKNRKQGRTSQNATGTALTGAASTRVRGFAALLAMLAALSFLATTASAEALDNAYAEKIANAIYRAEGGANAKSPYGILSVKVANEQEARRVCINTIKNNYRRWQNAGSPGEFIDFLGNRYCPPSVDPKGNVNWRKNVKAILARN